MTPLRLEMVDVETLEEIECFTETVGMPELRTLVEFGGDTYVIVNLVRKYPETDIKTIRVYLEKAYL